MGRDCRMASGSIIRTASSASVDFSTGSVGLGVAMTSFAAAEVRVAGHQFLRPWLRA